jgi:predicted peptidase
MMRALPFGFCLAALPFAAASGQDVQTGFIDRTVTVDGGTYRYQVYVPRDYAPSTRWPVILFLHGAGERGSDGLRQTAVGLGAAIRQNPTRYPAIVVLPQSPTDSTWTGTPARAAMAALDATLAAYATDPDRVYLTGLSMGGNGTWYIAYRHADRFAAFAPVCGWIGELPRAPAYAPVVPPADGDPYTAVAHKLRGKPVWIFHGEIDAVVPVEDSRQAAAALEAAGAEVRYTELPGINHNSWDPAYASPAFSEWLFAQRRAP